MRPPGVSSARCCSSVATPRRRSSCRTRATPTAIHPAPRRDGDPASLVASSRKAADELGWVPAKNTLADMIGDADLNINRDLSSTQWLEDVVYEAATRMSYQSHFFGRKNSVTDDHIPFMKKGVPCADLIDFDYGYNNVFWHTTEDTVDKLSPKSIEIAGSVMLETARILDKMDPLPPK